MGRIASKHTEVPKAARLRPLVRLMKPSSIAPRLLITTARTTNTTNGDSRRRPSARRAHRKAQLCLRDGGAAPRQERASAGCSQSVAAVDRRRLIADRRIEEPRENQETQSCGSTLTDPAQQAAETLPMSPFRRAASRSRACVLAPTERLCMRLFAVLVTHAGMGLP